MLDSLSTIGGQQDAYIHPQSLRSVRAGLDAVVVPSDHLGGIVAPESLTEETL